MGGSSASTREAESTVLAYTTENCVHGSERLGGADRRVHGKNGTQSLFSLDIGRPTFFFHGDTCTLSTLTERMIEKVLEPWL